MLKSYRDDLPYVERLLASFHHFNTDRLPLFLVVPRRDLGLFEPLIDERVHLMADEEVTSDHLAPGRSRLSDDRLGIANAGVTKLAFGRPGICRHYFAIDSDTVFVRAFGRDDFLVEDESIIVADDYPEPSVDPFYSSRNIRHQVEALDRVAEVLGVSPVPRHLRAHAGQVMSAAIVASLEERLAQRSLTFSGAMELAIYEFFWYMTWALGSPEEIGGRRSEFIRVVHHQGEHLLLHLAGVTSEDVARGHLGVIVNSNWSRQYGLIDFDEPPIGDYLERGAWADRLDPARRDVLRDLASRWR